MLQFAPFKPGSKGTLAERARALGLEPYALKFLNESARIADASDYIDKNTKGILLNFMFHKCSK